MLTERQVATLRAALLYWQEEICPHGPAAARPYLEPSDALALTDDEITALRQQLEAGVRYAIYDSSRGRLDGTELFDGNRSRPGEQKLVFARRAKSATDRGCHRSRRSLPSNYPPCRLTSRR